MKKLFVGIALAGALLCGGAFAETATLPNCDVTINGTKVDSVNREYPLLQYKDITYFPMTYYDCRFLGLGTNWDNSTRTFSVERRNMTAVYRSYASETANSKTQDVLISDMNINVNGEAIDNSKEEYPLLNFRGVTYFPLTWRFAHDTFGWEYDYSAENGLVINSANYVSHEIGIENLHGNIIADENYYYYAKLEDMLNIYQAPKSNPKEERLIAEFEPDPIYGVNIVDFSVKNGRPSLYLHFGGATMGSDHYYWIENGALKEMESYEHNHSYIGGYELNYSSDVMRVKYLYKQGIFYTIDGEETKVNAEGIDLNPNTIQILGRNIYVTGKNEADDSTNVYQINTTNGEVTEVLKNKDAFYAFVGWWNNEDTDMLYFVEGKELKRLTLNDMQTLKANTLPSEDMTLVCGVGAGYYTAVSGENETVVLKNDCYGIGSVQSTAILIPQYCGVYAIGGNVILMAYEEIESNDVRTAVVGNYRHFKSSDLVTNVAIFEDELYYVFEGKAYSVKLVPYTYEELEAGIL